MTTTYYVAKEDRWQILSLMGQSRPVRSSNESVYARYALKADADRRTFAD